MVWRAALASALVVGLGAAPVPAASFKVDAARSTLVVQLFRDGPASGLAHDHVVKAKQLAGTITYDPRDPAGAAIRVEVEVDSLVADDPDTRRAFGLEGELSRSDRTKIEEAMKADEQLAAARFPAISFASTSITKQTEREYLVRGRLTIRGVSRELRFPARIAVDGAELRGQAKVRFTQSSFGYRPYRALLGAIRNKDEVILHVDLVAKAS